MRLACNVFCVIWLLFSSFNYSCLAADTPPPAYNKVDKLGLAYGKNWNKVSSQRLRGLLEKLEVSKLFYSRLKYVQGSKIIFILDDSGSMTNKSDDQHVDQYGNRNYKETKTLTRWGELKQFVETAIMIYGNLSLGGVDFYFLNRGFIKGIRVFEQLGDIFSVLPEPTHLTPLSEALRLVLQDNKKIDSSLVLNIVTDGEPLAYDEEDNLVDDIKIFAETLKTIPKNACVNIRLCTNQENTVEAYNKLDVEIPRLDVSDDFEAESAEVFEKRGIKMTRGEYILKTTIGAADRSEDNFDGWDESSSSSSADKTKSEDISDRLGKISSSIGAADKTKSKNNFDRWDESSKPKPRCCCLL